MSAVGADVVMPSILPVLQILQRIERCRLLRLFFALAVPCADHLFAQERFDGEGLVVFTPGLLGSPRERDQAMLRLDALLEGGLVVAAMQVGGGGADGCQEAFAYHPTGGVDTAI